MACFVGAWLLQVGFGISVLGLMGLRPESVLGGFWVWQLVTYLFLHGGVFHILFNMLTLWMFGVELERMWGSRFFAKYYFVAGVGAGLTQIIASLLPFGPLASLDTRRRSAHPAQSMDCFWPTRCTFRIARSMFLGLFPIQVRYFVLIMGAISLLSAADGASGVAHMAHLGGIAFGYLYLKSPRWWPPQRGGRDQVPLREMAYQQDATEVRRLFRRPDRRVQTPHPLSNSPAEPEGFRPTFDRRLTASLPRCPATPHARD